MRFTVRLEAHIHCSCLKISSIRGENAQYCDSQAGQIAGGYIQVAQLVEHLTRDSGGGGGIQSRSGPLIFSLPGTTTTYPGTTTYTVKSIYFVKTSTFVNKYIPKIQKPQQKYGNHIYEINTPRKCKILAIREGFPRIEPSLRQKLQNVR